MCGIAGFVGPWSDRLLDAMLDRINHRGPDGSATWRDWDASFAVGHARLSIIDLSAAANQPMHTVDGRYVISFNGEIYNFKQLRRELESAGVVFRTKSDTEVLLCLFERQGRSCLRRLNGIFAFAVWDRALRNLFIARDHLGVKPLYYAALPHGFLFASELKALTVCPDVARDIDVGCVANHLAFVWSSSASTMLKSVRKLRPGHCAWIDANARLTIERYYDIPLPPPRSERVEPAALLTMFDRVVADQMVADVSVGACLSGGVDSSAVVASMCRATDPSRVVTFCASVSKDRTHADNFGDDIVHARDMAKRLEVPLVEVPTTAQLVEQLPQMLWDLDEPTGDFAALQTRMIAAEARRHGIKVLLTGTGGDDLFTGYGRHVAAFIWATLDQLPYARRLTSYLISGFPSNSVLGRRLGRLGQMLSWSEDEMLTEAMSFSNWPAEERALLLAKASGQSLDGQSAPFGRLLGETRALHPVDRLLQLDLHGFVPDLNLNYTDKMGMQEGVEFRVPLLDVRLVAFAMRVPVSQKIGLWQTKRILRKAMAARLNRAVLHRAKQGFGVPLRAWMAGPGRELAAEMTSPRVVAARGLFDPAAVARLRKAFDQNRNDVAFILFTLVCIEIWCRQLSCRPSLASTDARNAA
ncbi:asparagine synthase (glutamine-hydrolyzing) [Bradyrhizobium sp. CCBAU 051011]|jgi:asparagine synthase (glutamine-hydrolysing)|uniref:asparagine synthase (glutamine-hydrolyzing) n=1 Tax=Bradyrhizobium sp. CCBAU 051011 TaxID=858422 RepID=UPI0013741D2F|nr:asparagine synthase (glutamine-hydrolyzing) [Bradyrhizobium sp. CCBAU 051011]QHO71355.1 asparagine synthase (glutamine-hydrolyzing) [Bradyrhizobium sp. CCBAU 051011]